MVRYYKTNGIIQYSDDGWVTLQISPSVVKYYNYVIKKYYYYNRLNTPRHSSHVTIVAGKYENVTNHILWKKYDGKEIEIEYNSFIEHEGLYFWLTVNSEFLINLRRELGLSDYPKYVFHITVGNLKNL